MRFMVMHKVDDVIESGGPPSQRIIDQMGELVGESMKSGVFLDGAGLHRSARRVRLTSRGETVRGPYSGDNELIASMAMIKAGSMEEAAGVAERFSRASGGVEVEIGPVVQPWDLGFVPKPKKLEHEHFLLLVKGDAKTESGEAPTEEQRAATAALAEELAGKSVLMKRMSLAPSSKGKRLPAGPKETRRWLDGPFAESKELISGFSLIDLPSIDDAIAWADRYAAILGDANEVDIRELAD